LPRQQTDINNETKCGKYVRFEAPCLKMEFGTKTLILWDKWGSVWAWGKQREMTVQEGH